MNNCEFFQQLLVTKSEIEKHFKAIGLVLRNYKLKVKSGN